MTQWSKNKVLPSQINNGNEYTQNDALSLEAINAIINNSFFASEHTITVDSTLDSTSENPVQNKVVTNALAGKQSTIDSSHKLSSDLVDDTNKTNKFVTELEKSTWNNKQNAINSSNKLDSDLIDDTNSLNKFVTDSDIQNWNGKSVVSVSNTGTSTTEVNYITIDGVEKKLAGKEDLFYCTYGTTTSQEVVTALSNGKIPVVVREVDGVKRLYIYSRGSFYFDCKYGEYSYSIKLLNDVWSEEGCTLQTVRNKVISLSSSSTDTQYPSAKCVYDALQNVSIAVDSALSDSSENPVQNKIVTGALNNKQDLIDSSNKLNADLVDDSTTTNKFITTSQASKIDNAVQKTGDENIYGLKTFDQRPKVGISPDLPQAYQLLDYIEGTGSQYISTGTHSDGTRTVTAEIAFTDVTSGNTQILVGGRPLNGGAGMGYIALRNNHLAYLTGGTWKESSFTPVLNQKYTISCYQADGGPQSMSVNGTTILSSGDHSYGNTKTNYLFAFDNQNSAESYMKAKLYSCKIYDGSSLVRNFVPCLRLSDNKTGMFDRVSNTFYANQTVTEFTTGAIDTDASLVALKSDIEANPTLIGTESNLHSIKIKGINYIIEGEVVTVNGQSGSVTLNADDISDSDTTNKFVTASEKSQITTNANNITNLQTNKQDTLISGTTLKTINNQSLLGSGNIDVSGGGGGTGITNYEVIDRTSSLPTATATSPDFVQINGVLYQKKIVNVPASSSVQSAITDLTGTTWIFNDVLNYDPNRLPYEYYINFTSNYTQVSPSTILKIATTDNIYVFLYYCLNQGTSGSVYNFYTQTWSNDKKINITGGTDATNTDLIDWLKDNATLQTTAYAYEIVSSSIIQVSTMPASSSNVGHIVQYIGITDSTYTNGYFYKSNGLTWYNVNVQPSSGNAGVSSIGGATGAITLGSGLSISGNELSATGGGGTTYGWVGANTSISSTPSTRTVTVDMSQLITDYDANGEYELLLELTISIGSNVDIGIYISSDIITDEYNACRSKGLTGNSCIIPIKKYLYYRNNNSSMSSYIMLQGYRRVK